MSASQARQGEGAGLDRTEHNTPDPDDSRKPDEVTDLTKRWGSVLTQVQRSAWISFAGANPTRNVFGNTVVLTGLQMYMSVNRNLATIGVATDLRSRIVTYCLLNASLILMF